MARVVVPETPEPSVGQVQDQDIAIALGYQDATAVGGEDTADGGRVQADWKGGHARDRVDQVEVEGAVYDGDPVARVHRQQDGLAADQ